MVAKTDNSRMVIAVNINKPSEHNNLALLFGYCVRKWRIKEEGEVSMIMYRMVNDTRYYRTAYKDKLLTTKGVNAIGYYDKGTNYYNDYITKFKK